MNRGALIPPHLSGGTPSSSGATSKARSRSMIDGLTTGVQSRPTENPLPARLSLIKTTSDSVKVTETVEGGRGITTHHASVKETVLKWDTAPRTALLIKKRFERAVTEAAVSLSDWLREEKGVTVFVEPAVVEEMPKCPTFDPECEALHGLFDFVVCLGGDGTLLHVSSLFRENVPPVLSFNFGSMGFLTPFDFESAREELDRVLAGDCPLSLRMRLDCRIIRDGVEDERSFKVLNEVVVDRGMNPFLTDLLCFCDDSVITTVQGDGVIVATPTGSTAYSLSSAGSLCHPLSPVLLFTPICPHELSQRPLVFPDCVSIRIKVPPNSRFGAWCSFDGRERQELLHSDEIVVTASKYPVPFIDKASATKDWFTSLQRCLHWNSRNQQKALAKV